jgi:hypothetical protein
MPFPIEFETTSKAQRFSQMFLNGFNLLFLSAGVRRDSELLSGVLL